MSTAEALNAARLLGVLALGLGKVPRLTTHCDGQPETNAEHSIMLALVAYDLADRLDMELNRERLLLLALVHDAVEVLCGDTPSWGMSQEERAAKALRERRALVQLQYAYEDMPWMVEALGAYEAQACPEARWLRVIDKLCPRLAAMLGGVPARRVYGRSDDEARAIDARQRAALAIAYPEFPALHALLAEADRQCEHGHPQLGGADGSHLPVVGGVGASVAIGQASQGSPPVAPAPLHDRGCP